MLTSNKPRPMPLVEYQNYKATMLAAGAKPLGYLAWLRATRQ